MTALIIEALQNRIAQSEFGQALLHNPLLQKDIWSLTDLGYTPEDLIKVTTNNLRFMEFQLPWLKLMTKLTTLAQVNERLAADSVRKFVNIFRCLDSFMVKRGYSQATELNNHLLQKFVSEARQASKQERQRHIYYASQLWAEEKWLNIYFVPIRIEKPEPNIKVIPEEVLVQVYNKFDLLPPMLERLFRLQFALGWRISEMLIFPR